MKRILLAGLLGVALPGAALAQTTSLEAYVYNQSQALQPYGSGLHLLAVPSPNTNAAQWIPGNVLVTLGDTQTLTGKTMSGLNNVFSSIPSTSLSVTGVTPGSYTNANVTINAEGQVTTAANGSAGGGGGGSPPGGTIGQVQFNSAGTFGGFTLGGDCTLVTSTGIITCPKVNGVAFANSATTDATNASNIVSGTLPAARLPATAVTAGSYTSANVTVGADGRLTAASNGSGGSSGLGGMTAGQLAVAGTVNTITSSAPFGLTGNSTIVETTTGGLITGSLLPLATNGTVGAMKGDGQTVTCVTGTCSTTTADSTKTANYTIAAGDMGGQVNFNGASLTVAFPAVGAGVWSVGTGVEVTNFNATPLTLSATPTINGFLGTTIPQFGGLICTSNGTSLDCMGLGVLSQQALLNAQDQTLSGGANVTSNSIGTISSGTTTIDCGKSPLQFLTDNGAFTLAAPAADGSCAVLVTNGASAGAITFSGFSEGSATGDALTTTNTNKFTLSVWRINGTSGYRVAAHQ